MSRKVWFALIGWGSLAGCTGSEISPAGGQVSVDPAPVPGQAGSVGVGGSTPAPVRTADPVPATGQGGSDATGTTCGAGGESIPRPPPPAMFRPLFGATVKSTPAPPPLSGGTLAAMSNDRAVVADPERDRLYIVDLAGLKVASTVTLSPGDQPGRVVEGAAGIAHVVLRGGGAVVTVDTTTGAIKARRAVCAAPRGIAYDRTGAAVTGPARALLHVACAGGELVSFPAADDKAAAVRTVTLDRDLRDVVASGPALLVSRFRSAEILTIDQGGKVALRVQPGSRVRRAFNGSQTMSAAVAWRMIPVNIGADGTTVPGAGATNDTQPGALLVHQRAQNDVVIPGPGGYAGVIGCGSIVESAVTVVSPGASPGATGGPALASNVLPIDIALAPSGQVAVLAAGNANAPALASVAVFDKVSDVTNINGADCVAPPGGMPRDLGTIVGSTSVQPALSGRLVALAYTKSGALLAQSREPAQLWIVDPTAAGVGRAVGLATDSRADTGHDIFHANSSGDLACASCHPEGGDDGRVWNFACIGERRTQSLRAGISGTEPFHWDGDQKTFPHLVDDVFVGRMGGPTLATDQTDALLSWIDTIPTLPPLVSSSAAAATRGKALFDSAAVGCGSCHAGKRMTNNVTIDVGTEHALQVPSLTGVGWRAPFMHNGCAPTLADRFGDCGGGDQHGHTSQLTSAQVADLVAYLESL